MTAQREGPPTAHAEAVGGRVEEQRGELRVEEMHVAGENTPSNICCSQSFSVGCQHARSCPTFLLIRSCPTFLNILGFAVSQDVYCLTVGGDGSGRTTAVSIYYCLCRKITCRTGDGHAVDG